MIAGAQRAGRPHAQAGDHGGRRARDPRARSRKTTGSFFIDDDALREAGVTDFSQYAVKIGAPLLPDLFL